MLSLLDVLGLGITGWLTEAHAPMLSPTATTRVHLPTFPLVGCQLAASTEVAGTSDQNTLAFSLSLVLVPAGCSKGVPQTGNLIDSRSLLLTALEAGGWRSWRQHGAVRALFLCFSWRPPALSSHGGRGCGALWSLHPHGLSTFQRPHPITDHLLQGLGFQHMILAGTY